jgi:hypothetical protein
LAGETEVLGENLLQCYFIYHKSHRPAQGPNSGRPGEKPATNLLSYGTALVGLRNITKIKHRQLKIFAEE